MLKLEKIGLDKSIYVTLRGKDPFWNPTFRRAFCLAFLLHFVAFGIFRIQPFTIRGSQQNFSPAFVNVDFEADREENLTLASLEYEKRMDWLQPLASKPLFPHLSLPLGSQNDSLLEEQMPTEKGERPTLVKWTYEEWHRPHLAKKWTVQLWSPLGEIESNIQDILQKNASQLERFPSCRLTYQVYIDSSTGQLAYWNLMDLYPINQKNICNFMEKLFPQFQCFTDKKEKEILKKAILELILTGSELSENAARGLL